MLAVRNNHNMFCHIFVDFRVLWHFCVNFWCFAAFLLIFDAFVSPWRVSVLWKDIDLQRWRLRVTSALAPPWNLHIRSRGASNPLRGAGHRTLCGFPGSRSWRRASNSQSFTMWRRATNSELFSFSALGNSESLYFSADHESQSRLGAGHRTLMFSFGADFDVKR